MTEGCPRCGAKVVGANIYEIDYICGTVKNNPDRLARIGLECKENKNDRDKKTTADTGKTQDKKTAPIAKSNITGKANPAD